jgi:glycosyltransferase involved in cell wall biosynthesis
MTPRIAIFQRDNYALSPFGKHLANMAPLLFARGVLVDLITTSDLGFDSLPQSVRGIALTGVSFGRLDLPKHYVGIPQLVRYFREYAPDAIIGNGIPFGVASLIALKIAKVKTRCIVSIHIPLSAEINVKMQRASKIYPTIAKLLFPQAHAIVAVSSGVADDIARLTGLSRESISVIHNPVVTDETESLCNQPVDHPWFGSERSHKIILTVGRFVPEKDHPTLIRALSRVREHIDARLVIIGDGLLRGELERHVANSNLQNYVALLGRKDNPLAYMSKSDIFVLSSKYEGLGNVLIEALASGCPIVATDCLSGPAEVLQNGKWGKLVPVGDDEKMSAAILENLQIPPQRERLKLRAQDFHADRVVDQYLELIFQN